MILMGVHLPIPMGMVIFLLILKGIILQSSTGNLLRIQKDIQAVAKSKNNIFLARGHPGEVQVRQGTREKWKWPLSRRPRGAAPCQI